MDQANALRGLVKLKEKEKSQALAKNARVITITSGKGGVGKTNFAVNLAINLRKYDKKVVIIDADFGLANIEVLFGVNPKYTIMDIFDSDKEMKDIIFECEKGIELISGGSNLDKLSELSESQFKYIVNNFSYLDEIFDFIIVDTGAGASKSVLNFIEASNETIIVTTPEPTSLTDAYVILKNISFDPERDINIVVNKVENEKEGLKSFGNISNTSLQFLNLELKHLGNIPEDKNLVKAVKNQEPASISFPDSNYAKAMEVITMKILNLEEVKPSGMMTYIKKLKSIFKN